MDPVEEGAVLPDDSRVVVVGPAEETWPSHLLMPQKTLGASSGLIESDDVDYQGPERQGSGVLGSSTDIERVEWTEGRRMQIDAACLKW